MSQSNDDSEKSDEVIFEIENLDDHELETLDLNDGWLVVQGGSGTGASGGTGGGSSSSGGTGGSGCGGGGVKTGSSGGGGGASGSSSSGGCSSGCGGCS